MEFLRRHPFAVDAHFARSVVLAYALPIEQLQARLPRGLMLDTFQDKWGFLAVAMVDTRSLRPANMPKWLGRDFSLIGYRIFAKYRDSSGRLMRGLYILRSETDRKTMQIFGNIFTRYNYRTTDVSWGVDEKLQRISVQSRSSALDVLVEQSVSTPSLPEGSPFADWEEARKFAGPMPFTFSPTPVGKKMVIIEGKRSHWDPRPLTVLNDRIGFMEREGFTDAKLANAFEVTEVPYHWSKGRLDQIVLETAQD